MKPLYRFYIANDSTPLYNSPATVEDNSVLVPGSGATTIDNRPGYFIADTAANANVLFVDAKKLLTSYSYYSSGSTRRGVIDLTTKSSFFVRISGMNRLGKISGVGSSTDLPPVYISHQAYPIFGDDLKKEWKKESKQAFFRQSLKGKLKFVKDDYDYIMSSSLGSYHCVKIEHSMDNGATWGPFFEGYFRRTDARIVPEDRLVEVQLNTLDLYEALLNEQDKEFDLIKLAPEINQLTLFKRPALQIYSPGEKVITTFVGGVYWEQECEAISNRKELNTVHGFTPEVSYTGTTGHGVAHFAYAYLAKPDNTLDYTSYIYLGVTVDYNVNPYEGYYYGSKDSDIRLMDRASSSPLNWTVEARDTDGSYFTLTRAEGLDDYGLFAFSGARPDGSLVTAFVQIIYKQFVARVLHDNNDYSGTKVNIVNTGAFGENRNYRYATPFSIEDLAISGSGMFSDKPTEFGQMQPNIYYKRPLSTASYPGFYLPIAKSQWGAASFWLRQGNYVEDLIDSAYRKAYTLKHAYPLHSCISVLLKQIAPNVSFSNDPAHSGFFYDNKANLIAMFNSGLSNLHITPITNILKGAYDQPAQKCTIKLKDLFNLVKDLFNCYWYIDGNNLRIEHIRYFNNGLDYVGGINSAQPDLDVTLLLAPRIHKTWLLGQSEYKYELDDLPERYQFSWPDDVTEPFIGWPIEVKNDYVKKGEISEISVSKFVSDIDFMLLNPGSFSEDNIAVLAPDNNGVLQYLNQNLGVIGDDFYTEYSLQNGQLSFLSLVPRYYRDNISGKDVIINKVKYQNTLALNVIRTKEQVINIPFVENLTENSLVKTGLGIGRVDAMELNLNSNIVKITLKHDTE